MTRSPEQRARRMPTGVENKDELHSMLIDRLNEIESVFGDAANPKDFDVYRIITELRMTLMQISHRIAENEATIKNNADDIETLDDRLTERNREFKQEMSQALERIEREIEKQMNMLNSSMQTVRSTVRELEIMDAERRPMSKLTSHVVTLIITAVVTSGLALILMK